MTRRGKADPADTRPGRPVQAAPTSPRPRDAAGNELDQWGLPIAGPLRAARLAGLAKPDPNVEPEAWASVGTGAALVAPAAPDAKEEADG
ncbi:MAG: hypothetical protein AB7E60_01915 [Sphingobium sp.]